MELLQLDKTCSHDAEIEKAHRAQLNLTLTITSNEMVELNTSTTYYILLVGGPLCRMTSLTV